MSNEGRINQGQVNPTSTTDNRGARYERVGTVHNAPVIHNTVHQTDSTVHHVDREDPWLLEALSKFLLGLVGDGRTVALGLVFSATGIGLAIVPAITSISQGLVTPLFWAGMVLTTVGFAFIAAFKFKRSSTCPECREEYSLKEQDGATAREVETSEGVFQEVTRPYRCSNCGFQTNRRFKEEVEAAE